MGLAVIPIFARVVYLSNTCDVYTDGTFSLKPSEACCACGGGEPAAVPVRGTPQDPLTVDALQDIYDATNGDTWTDKKGWTATENFCTYSNIRCDAQSRLLSVAFYEQNLTGTLPKSIGDLVTLKILAIGPDFGVLETNSLLNHSSVSGGKTAACAVTSRLCDALNFLPGEYHFLALAFSASLYALHLPLFSRTFAPNSLSLSPSAFLHSTLSLPHSHTTLVPTTIALHSRCSHSCSHIISRTAQTTVSLHSTHRMQQSFSVRRSLWNNSE